MALTQVTGPYPIFTDLDGTPLDDGYLYIGDVNQDPEQNPIQVFWDANLTIPATQPIRTSNGYAYRNGTPALLYTAGEFSITIRNKREEFVLYSPVGYGFDPAAVSASVVKNDFTGNGVQVAFVLSASPSTILATNIFINGVYQEKDSYTLAGNTITFSIAPPLNSSIEVMTNETGVINSGNATAISYTASFPGATLQTVQTKLEQYVSVKDFGAVGDGVTDDGPACRAAITAVETLGGGTVYFPAGTYRLVKDPLDTLGNSALTLTGSVHLVGAGVGGSNAIDVGAAQIGTTLTCGGASTVLIRVTGMYNSVSNMTLLNAASHANTSGIRLAPQDEAQTTTRSDVSYNTFDKLYVNNFDEGVVLRPGPRVGGADSYCYYNTFTNINYFNCRIGLWLKAPPTQPGSGSNRNTFISMRFGSNYNGNTGIQLDAGDTCKFIACSFEGLQYGTSPNNPPSAIAIAYNTASYGAVDNMFYGTVIEACTRGVANLNDRVEFHGTAIFPLTSNVLTVNTTTGFAVGDSVTATNMAAGTVTFVSGSTTIGVKRTSGTGTISGTLSDGTNSATISADTKELGVVNLSPTGAVSLLTDPQYGSWVSKIGTNRWPTVGGDFHNAGADSVVMASTSTGGQPEFRVDTGTAYGLYSFYASGVKQWSMGTQATGNGNITFFNASDAVIGQFVAASNGAFKPLQASSAPTYIKGAIYFDTTLNKLRVGGATNWETITSV